MVTEYLVSSLLLALPFTAIFRKTGFSPAWGLLGFVPIIGPMLAMLILAFRWR